MTAGLTPDDVFAACERLRREDVPLSAITGHAVWRRLGRGSKSTVQKYTMEWLSRQNSGPPPSRTAVMATIQDLIDKLVDQVLRDERDQSRLAVEELQAENRLLALASVRATAELEDLRQKFADLKRQLVGEQAYRKEVEVERDRLSRKLSRAQRELSDALRLRDQDSFIRDAVDTLAAHGD